MMLRLQLTDDLERQLRERAAAAGKDVEVFAREALEQKLRESASLGEILAPLHEAFAASGLTPEEWDAEFERLRDEAYAERQKLRAKAS